MCGPPNSSAVVWRLSEENLGPALAAALGKPDALIEVLDFSRQALPLGTLLFQQSSLGAEGLWRGSVTYGDRRSVPVWARVRITRADGSVISEWRAAKAPLILRGDTVRVEVRSGGVVLAFDAPAESSGRAGEEVMVRNPANGQRFRATVEATGKVAIQK
jgi:hypothetical protein